MSQRWPRWIGADHRIVQLLTQPTMSAPAEPSVTQDVDVQGNDNEVNIAGRDIRKNITYILSLSGSRWIGLGAVAVVLGGVIPLAIFDPPPVKTSVSFRQTFETVPVAAATSRIAAAPNARGTVRLAKATRPRIDETMTPSAPAPKSITQVSYEPSAPAAVMAEPTEWPEGSSALCRDGSYSPSQTRSGSCAGHHGVAVWRYPADHPYWNRQGQA